MKVNEFIKYLMDNVGNLDAEILFDTEDNVENYYKVDCLRTSMQFSRDEVHVDLIID